MARFVIYYELPENFSATVAGMTGRYFALGTRKTYGIVPQIHYDLYDHADRIWQQWDDGEIILLKNRFALKPYQVDMKEFMWIKLASKNLN